MPAPKCSDEEFIRLFQSLGARGTAEHLGVIERNVYRRRASIERTSGRILAPTDISKGKAETYPKRLPMEIRNGTAIIGSDPHYWPDLISTAHRGLVKLTAELKPALVCLNGDGIDGPSNSRHSPIGWEKGPDVGAELETVDARSEEIRDAHPKAQFIWNLGNHDMRFENYLSERCPQYRAVKGMRLADQLPMWQFAWSLWVNHDVVIKHRFKGGVHATHNNAVYAGKTMVTGHLHSLKVTPFSDYNGTRFGIDSGTMADPYGPQFSYAEDNPLNHRSGFIVLTFHDGRLLWPEIAAVVDDKHIQFRGQVIAV